MVRDSGELVARPRTGGHPSPVAVAGDLQRSTRELGRATLERPLSDLAPGGVYRAARVTSGAGGLLHHRFTLTRVDAFAPPRAVCFLWHCPAGHPGWALPTTLPCGARTFLGGCPQAPDATARPARPPSGHSTAYAAGSDTPASLLSRYTWRWAEGPQWSRQPARRIRTNCARSPRSPCFTARCRRQGSGCCRRRGRRGFRRGREDSGRRARRLGTRAGAGAVHRQFRGLCGRSSGNPWARGRLAYGGPGRSR